MYGLPLTDIYNIQKYSKAASVNLLYWISHKQDKE